MPDEVVDDSAIIGDIDCVRKQIGVWAAHGRHHDGGRRAAMPSTSPSSPGWWARSLRDERPANSRSEQGRERSATPATSHGVSIGATRGGENQTSERAR